MWYDFLGQPLGAGCVVWLPGSDFRSMLCDIASWYQTLGGAGCVVWLSGSDFRRSRLCGMAFWV